jgi:hypothetical protein
LAKSAISRRVTLGCDERVAAGDDLDGVDELGGRGVLEEEAGCPGAERVVDVLVEVEGGQHEHGGALAVRGEETARRFDAVHGRHADVHEDDVGARGGGEVDRLASVGRLADEGESRRRTRAGHRSRRVRALDRRRPSP